jgi:membrane protein YqaA with SNARE-associated domain
VTGGWNGLDVTLRQDHGSADSLPDDVRVDAALLAAGQGINYRVWFVCFLGWLGALAAAAKWGIFEIDQSGSAVAWAVWILALTAFYLSLCCTFFPPPTTWIVLLAASDMIAGQAGITGHEVARVIVVATVCALASSLANLNEYHIVAYLMRSRRLARIRQTRLYLAASGWFHKSPFWILMLFSFIPIPVDVIRWLAVLGHYDRGKFVLANFIGRWFRYALCAVVSLGLDLTPWQILVIQAVLVAFASVKFLLQRMRSKNHHVNGQEPKATPIVGEAEGA